MKKLPTAMTIKRPAQRATAAVTAVALAALALAAPLAHAQTAPAAPATTAAVVSGNAPPVPLDNRQREYLIGAGDVLRVAVYQNPDLAIETRVSDTGQISFPLLGQVTVGGLTVPQVEKALADGLRTGNFVKQPQVTVLVTQVRGNQASALGMVNRPGRFPIDVSGMRLSELLAQAGGIAPGGSDVVILTGIRNGQPYRLQVDIAALFANGAQSQDPVVLNGDTIYVERMPTVYIYGEVQRPGAIRLESNMTLMQALASGGGLTQRGTTRGLRVHRRNGEGRVEELQPGMNDALQNGDVIYIRESLF